MVIDHVMIYVSDYLKSRAFYDNTLAILKIKRLMTFDDKNVAGYGLEIKPTFWISDQSNRGAGEVGTIPNITQLLLSIPMAGVLK